MKALRTLRAVNTMLATAIIAVCVLAAGCGSGNGGTGGGGGGGGSTRITFSSNTSNMTAPATDIASATVSLDCAANCQLTYTASDSAGGANRNVGVDQFDESAAVGTVWNIASGFDAAAGTGVHVSYLDSVGLTFKSWTADTGTVTLTAKSGKTYTLTLTNVHVKPTFDPFGGNPATGEVTMNGTIVATLP